MTVDSFGVSADSNHIVEYLCRYSKITNYILLTIYFILYFLYFVFFLCRYGELELLFWYK